MSGKNYPKILKYHETLLNRKINWDLTLTLSCRSSNCRNFSLAWLSSFPISPMDCAKKLILLLIHRSFCKIINYDSINCIIKDFKIGSNYCNCKSYINFSLHFLVITGLRLIFLGFYIFLWKCLCKNFKKIQNSYLFLSFIFSWDRIKKQKKFF